MAAAVAHLHSKAEEMTTLEGAGLEAAWGLSRAASEAGTCTSVTSGYEMLSCMGDVMPG